MIDYTNDHNDEETIFDENGCPIHCPGLDDYPNCYCMDLIADKNDSKDTTE